MNNIINNMLFERILSHHGKMTKIEWFDAQPAFGNGENYSSSLTKLDVKYSDGNAIQRKRFIMKATLGEKLVRSRNVFAKEICIYNEIIPRIESVFKAANIPTKLTPKCYDSDVQQSYLILEDLTFANYYTIPRSQGLNFDHIKLCLRTLALWHAASVKIMNNEIPSFYDIFLMPHVSLNGSPHYRTLFENAVSACSKTFENHSNLQKIAQKLNQLTNRVFEKCCVATERYDKALNVLTHGDLWSNNIMFSTELSTETLPLFLDFQMSYFGSPILDVSYLLFTSANDTVTSDEFNQLFDYYCEQLIDVMLKLDLPTSTIPSKIQLQNEFDVRGCYGAFFSLFSVPMRILEHANDNDVKLFLNKSQEGREFREQIYSNPNVQTLLINLLTYFNKKHFL
ncbi:uncharacterized protein LOC129575663, partial [Sitodiplosis mosellana]|uniref:uncharacterized protein LOC129575663 n=1 Tax=Sitodiplosis mosellana TaxID=263140 RepID=UPI002443A12F